VIRAAQSVFLAGFAASAVGADIFVSSASDIAGALGSLQPGDTLIMTDGVWTDQNIEFEANGTAAQPITLRAQTPGGVILNGDSTLEFGGQHLIVDGLRFEGGALTGGHVIQFREGSNECTDCVLRNTAIIDYNPPSISTRYFWVSMYGTDNVVENCRFENHNHSGVTIVVWGDWPNRHVIRNNYFVDRPQGPENGWETIRLGTSGVTDLSSQTLIESNLFERTNGEIEVISDKTEDNIHRRNTFREMSATLTLRHATDAIVEGNFFLGEGASGAGGVRVIGPGHRIYNNYFEGLSGRTQGIIALEAGEPNAANSGYEPVSDCIIAHNTFVDCNDPAIILDRSFGNAGRTVLPVGVTIAGNLMSLPGESAVIGVDNGFTWADNLAFTNGLGTASGTTLLGTDPLSTSADGLQRPDAGGVADDATSSSFAFLTDDLDGQARDSSPDTGADEISADSILYVPLNPDDVGPAWWADDIDPPVGVNPALGAAIEAEDADAILDPDNDGSVFTIVADAAASNASAIESPSGARTDIPGDTQETVATYTIAFPTSGNYTAYYRAVGFSGSSDSFYTPSGFSADPGVNESTSNNGAYRWEEGDTFAVAAGNLQQEFRISRREASTRIDVIVFYPEEGLADSELDFLAANADAVPCAADLDKDGEVTFFDTLEFLRLFDAEDPAADLSPGGGFNAFDLTLHLLAAQAGCP